MNWFKDVEGKEPRNTKLSQSILQICALQGSGAGQARQITTVFSGLFHAIPTYSDGQGYVLYVYI